jgi:hypothetical protein
VEGFSMRKFCALIGRAKWNFRPIESGALCSRTAACK